MSVAIAPALGAAHATAAQVTLRFSRTSILRMRRGTTTLTFRCGLDRCSGTIALLRTSGRAVVRSRFTSDRTGHVRARLRLPRSLRPFGAHRVHLRLRVTASATAFRTHTVERAISLAAGAG